jgi:peroxin-11B
VSCNLAGYDKVLRTLQYTARFWAWWLHQNPQVRRPRFDFEFLARQCSLTRKISGSINFGEHLIAAITAYKITRNSDRDNILRLLSVCHHLGYAIYSTSDIILYLEPIGLISSSAATKYQHRACKAWFFGLACSITRGWYRLRRLHTEKDMTLKPHDAMARTEIRLQLVSDYCDILIASTILRCIKHSDGFVSVSGTISSLIGVWKVWKRTA